MIILRASAAGIWANCPGSIKFLKLEYPLNSNAAAKFGNAVHKAAANTLTGCKDKLTGVELAAKIERQEEFEKMHDFYLSAIPKSKNKKIIEIEISYKTKNFIIVGHPDFAEYFIKNKTLYLNLIDLKTGRLPVEAIDNLQLFVYAHLIVYYLLQKKLIQKDFKIVIQGLIVQTFFNEEKFADIEYDFDQFKNLYDFENKNKFVCGSWCTYCPGSNNALCKEYKKKMHEFFKPQFLDESYDLSENLADILQDAQTLNKITKRIIDNAKQYIKDGQKIGNWKIIKKNGRQVFLNNTNPTIVSKKTCLPIKDIMEVNLKSPAEIKKLKKNADLSGLTFQTQNEFLVLENNERMF